eukprot:5728874-Pleurochrysis_carterae.AAC.1
MFIAHFSPACTGRPACNVRRSGLPPESMLSHSSALPTSGSTFKLSMGKRVSPPDSGHTK